MSKYDYFKEKKISFFGRLTHKVVQDKIVAFLQKEVVSGKIVLEIGPGVGGLAKLILDSGYTYMCVDRSETLIDSLVKLGIDAKYGEVPPLPYESSSVDCIVLMNVFEHMADSEKALALLNEIYRVLKTNGKVLMLVPNCTGWGFDFYEVDYTHSFEISAERMRQIFSDSNFHINSMSHTYGFLSGVVGFVCDKINNTVFSILYQIFPLSSKMIKGKILFHPTLWIVGHKK